MSSWFSNPFNRNFNVPSVREANEPVPTSVVKIRNMTDLRKFLKATGKVDIYRFNNRRYKTPLSLTLNMFLYYVDYRGLMDNTKYKVETKVVVDFIDYCHYNSFPEDAQYTRVALGGTSNSSYYYMTLIDGGENPVLTASLKFEHTHFRKAAAAMFRTATKSKEKAMFTINTDNLKSEQRQLRSYMEPWLGKGKPVAELQESSSDVTFTESFDSSELSMEDTTIAAPKSIRAEIQKQQAIENALPMPESKRRELLANVNNDNAHNVSTVQVDQTLMDEELIEALNEDPVITSLLEPEPSQSNIELITQDDLMIVEKEVLRDQLKERVLEHHEKKSRSLDDAYEGMDVLNDSTVKKLRREEIRYESRRRSGRLNNGPHGMGVKTQFDYRGETHDIRGRQIQPNKSFTKQDDDYLDYAFYGFIREYGTVINDIMKLPLGYEFNSQRRGSNVYIRAIHFRNTFTHVTGTKATGRMIVFSTEKESSYTNILGRHWNTVKTEDILQKSVTMYAGDLEEMEAADVFYNPTVMSQYDFKNVILGNQFEIVYDYYADLNTQAVKGVVGEDIESVDSIKSKWVKLDDLDIPLFYEGNDSIPLRGQLGIVFMGDYFGGEVETNCTMRVFYNSN
jgi:hypothetical protein